MKIVERREEIVIDYEYPKERRKAIAVLDKENFFILKNEKIYSKFTTLNFDIYRLIGRKTIKKERK